jgi:hypothetical protein
MEESSIVAKIQKLLALSTSNNHNEAAAALHKANRLMQEHDISCADIQSNELNAAYGEVIEVTRGEVISQSKYKHLLFNAVGKLCKVRVIGVRINRQKYKLKWVGRQHRIEIAIHMYEYLLESIDRIMPAGLRGDRKKSFQIGAAINVYERVESMLEQNEIDLSNNPDKISLAFVDNEQEIDRYMDKYEGVVVTKKVDIKQGSLSGYKAANQISLATQIDNSDRIQAVLTSK